MSIIWDNHTCISLQSGKTDFYDELELHRQAGFSVVSLNIGYADTPWKNQIDLANRLTAWLKKNDDKFIQIKVPSDLLRIDKSNKLGVFFDVEGANLLQGDITRIPILYDVGVRWMCLTYNETNSYVGGCLPSIIDGGLTELGRDAVDMMNKVGMVVCCSHTGKKSAMDIIEASKKPTIFSHSNSNSIFKHWRNIDDDVALACAEKGGVICINGVGPFLGDGSAMVPTFMNHMLYMINLVGVEHVGIGLDFVHDMDELEADLSANQSIFAEDISTIESFTFVHPSSLEIIEQQLIISKFSNIEIAAILGGNLERVAREVWT